MIHTHAILTGYIALRGSMLVHIPMLIAMLSFVRVPDAESPNIGAAWHKTYMYAVSMHALLSVMHFFGLLNT